MSDTVFADVSYFQAKVDDSYPHRVLSIRSNDGTFRDPNFSHNYQWCVNAVAGGRLDCFIVYAYWRTDWLGTANTMRDMVNAEGGPHPRMVAMVDLESGGNPGGDQSGGVNAWCDNIAGWLGTPSGGGRVIGYGNQSDLRSMWPNRPAGMRMVVAGYGGASPGGFPGFLAHQYTDGGGYGAPAPQGAPPFGACDMNSADGLDPVGFCAAVGLGAVPTNVPPPPMVGGAIGDLYNTLGGPGGFLGNPTTPETGCPDGVGRYNHFDHGSIYWTSTTGAHEVHGAFHAAWQAQGWETGKWGYPISNEVPCSEGAHQYFQGTAVFWRAFNGNITELK